MSNQDDIVINIRWYDSEADETRVVYRETTALKSRVMSEYNVPSPGREVVVSACYGFLDIVKGNQSLFSWSSAEPGNGTNVLEVLFALAGSARRVSTGHPLAATYAPDFDHIVVRTTADDVVCMATSSTAIVCADRAEWVDKLACAIDEVRRWLLSNIPELADDETLGPWLAGGDPPGELDFSFPYDQRSKGMGRRD